MLKLNVNPETLEPEERVQIHIDALGYNDPVPMIAAVRALYALGMDDEHVWTNMRKIAYRRAGVVRDFIDDVVLTGRDQWQTAFTEFAKNVDQVGR